MTKITLIENTDGDWEALYINGKQFEEGHSVQFTKLLRELHKRGVLHFEQVEVEDDGDGSGKCYPTDLPLDLTTIPYYQV